MRHKPNCAVYDPCPSECDCQKTDYELMREWQIKAEQKDREILALRNHIAAMGTIPIPLAEYEKLKADAERYAEARKGKALVVECTNRHGKYVIYHIGDRDEAVDFPERYDEAIDAAIKQEGGA